MSTMRLITEDEANKRNILNTLLGANSKNVAEFETSKSIVADKGFNNVLSKYIPVTIITVYTAIDSMARLLNPPPVIIWMVFFGVVLVLTPWLSLRFTKDDTTNIPSSADENLQKAFSDVKSSVTNQQNKQAIVATIAFFAYVLAIGGPFTYLNSILSFTWQPFYGTCLSGIFVIIIAGIIGKDIFS